MNCEDRFKYQRSHFMAVIDDWYKNQKKNEDKRFELGIKDSLTSNLLDFVFYDCFIQAYAGGGRHCLKLEPVLSDILMEVLDSYVYDQPIHYTITTAVGKSITITCLEECFDCIYLLGLEGNLYQRIHDYLKFAEAPYHAVLFFDSEDILFNIDDFWSNEQLEDISNWLTIRLKESFNLSNCFIFWDNEKFILIDNDLPELE